MPCTLRVPANRHQARVRPADHAAHQRQVGDRLHVVHAVHVVRDAHRPAEDGVLRRGVSLGDRVDVSPATRPTSRDLVPRKLAQARHATRASPAQCSLRNASSCAPISSIRLAMPVSSARSPPMCGCTYSVAILVPNSRLRMSLGTRKLTRPVSTTGLMTMHVAAAAADRHQRSHQPRMIAGRVAADQEHQVGVLDVVKRAPSPCRCRATMVSPTPLA